MLGGKTDLIACASRAIEALKLFHYDAIFYDPVAMGEGTPEVLHQIQDLSSDGSLRDIPLIEVGTKLNTQTQATVLLNGPVTTTDLVEVFRRCRLLPELPRPRSSKLSSEEPEAERTIAEDQVTPILAPERLEELRKLAVEGENVLDDLFLLFREEVPPRVDELRGAVDREDWAAARFSVHAVSGVCLNLGAIRMESLCRRLQTKLDEGQVEGVLELVEAIRLATADVEAALEEAGEQPSDVGLNHRRGES